MTHNIEMVKKYIYYRKGNTDLSFYPDRLYLELTNNCNFQCIMCPNGRGLMKREKGFMDHQLAKRIIDEMGPHIDTIVLHIWGESLLHPRIFDIIEYCQKYKLKTELSTNASLLTEHNTSKIIDSGLSVIYLCMDGASKKTYEYVRKNGNYENTIKNISDFLKVKKDKKGDIFVNLQIIVMTETKDEIETFKNRWSLEEVNRINIKPLDTWGGQIAEINKLKINDDIKKTNQMEINRRKINHEKINYGKTNYGKTNRYHCPNLWYHCHIYFDGSMVCCDRDYDAKYSLGNVKEGVMNIWNGPKMQELRKKHIAQELDNVPSCNNCNEWCWWKPTLFSSWGNIPKE